VEADAKQQKSRSRLSGSKLNWMQFNSHYWVPLLNTVVQMRGCWYRFSMDYVEVPTAILKLKGIGVLCANRRYECSTIIKIKYR